MMTSTATTETISVPLTQEILDQCLNCPSNSAVVLPLSSMWNGADCSASAAYSLTDIVGDGQQPSATIVIDSSPAAAPTASSRADDVAVTYVTGYSGSVVDRGRNRTLVPNRRSRPKALSTAPTVVELRRRGQSWCAFARRRLPAHSRFGPFDAPLGDHPSLDHFILAVPAGGHMQYLNVDDDTMTDWMKFVRPTRDKRQQNLEVVYCDGEGIFFDATRAINTNEELRVWYSDEYERDLRTAGLLNEQSNWLLCVDCDIHFDNTAAYEQHIQLEHASALPNDYSDDDVKDPAFSLRDRSLAKIRPAHSRPAKPKRFQLSKIVIPLGRRILLRYLKWTMARSQRRYTYERRFYCKKCRLKMYSARENANHAQKHELFGEAAHVCQFCGRRFFVPQTLKAHSLSTHVTDQVFYCDVCNSTFARETLLDIHTRSHMTTNQWSESGGDGGGSCPAIGCYERFSTDADLVEHVSATHALPSASRRSLPDPSLACRCELCGRSFQTSSARISHMSTHRDAHARQFKCPLCDIVFSSPKLIPQHVTNTHKANGHFNCSLCDRTFDSWIGAQRHGRYYHAKSQYDCTVCGKQFLRSDKLRNHMTTHSEDRPWLCEICGARYKRKDKLNHHVKNHANEGHKRASKTSSRAQLDRQQYAASDFRCELCLIGFKKRGMLVNHVASKHRSDPASEVAPCLLKSIARPKMTFGCALCPKTYSARRKLKSHVEKYHGQQFQEAESTLVFDGNVTEMKPYRCSHCPKEYLHKSHLVAHAKKEHANAAEMDKDEPSTSSGRMSAALKRSLARLKPIAPSVSTRKKKQSAPTTTSSSGRSTAKSITNEDDLLSQAISIADVDLSLLMTPPHNSSGFTMRTPNLTDSQ